MEQKRKSAGDVPQTTVVYNDTCPICAREVAQYKKLTSHDSRVCYTGWSEEDYDRFGLSRDQAAGRFHVVRDGKVVSGIPAFAILWGDMRGMRWASRAVQLPVVAPIVGWIYDKLLAPALFAMHKRRERRGTARRIG